jgi:hypothetical protein
MGTLVYPFSLFHRYKIRLHRYNSTFNRELYTTLLLDNWDLTSTVTIDSLLFERKLENVTEGLAGECRNIIIRQIRSDAFVLIDYMLALKTEINPSDNYRKSVIKNVGKFMKFCRLSTNKPLKELERDDVLAYLDSLRKSESSDSLHKWIGTYNLHRVHLLRFFKWLHSPDIEQHKRPKPSVVDNIPQLRRKEKSILLA